MSASVKLQDVTFGYVPGRPPVVDGLCLSVPAGGVTTVLGPSGSGKSTVLSLVAGIATPWRGGISIDGSPVHDVPPADRGVALVMQQPYLFPNLSVGDNVTFGLAARGMSRRERRPLAQRWLARMGLDGFADRRPRTLSGGQQQRVALARALAVDPQVLLLDEPLASLDVAVRDALQAELRTVVAETGVTAIMVTHDLPEAMAMGAHTVLLEDGRVVADGPSHQVFTRPPTVAAARMVGVTTFVPGVPRNGVLDTPRGPVAVSGLGVSGSVLCAIRPEHVRIVPASEPDGISGTVEVCVFRGEHWDVTLETRLGTITARSDRPLTPSTTAAATLPPQHLFPVADDTNSDGPRSVRLHPPVPGT